MYTPTALTFDTSTPSYLISICSLTSTNYAISSLESVKLLDLSTQTLSSISIKISGLGRQVHKWSENELVVASSDCLALHDIRQQDTLVQSLAGIKKPPLLCGAVSPSSNVIASGSELFSHEAYIDLWDIRNTSTPAVQYTQCHSNDIASLSFHPNLSHLLLSSSTDGLFSVIDARIQDEDDAVLGVGNVDASLKKAEWMSGDAASSILCLTDHECVSVWTSEEPEILHDYSDIRQRNINGDWQADYILDSCKGADEGSVTLFLASKTRGLVGLKTLNASKGHALIGGHAEEEMIRCVAVADNDLILTGGEDNTLVIWSKTAPTNERTTQKTRKAGKESHRFNPYSR